MIHRANNKEDEVNYLNEESRQLIKEHTETQSLKQEVSKISLTYNVF